MSEGEGLGSEHPSRDDATPRTVERLLIASADGIWAVRSDDGAVYFLDASLGRVLRRAAVREPTGPGDGEWMGLLSVRAVAGEGPGIVLVGERHRYLYEYDSSGPEVGWWIQRRVVAIEAVDTQDVVALPHSRSDDS